MAEEKSRGKLFFYAVLLLILFFGLIGVFVNAGGLFFALELIGLLFLLLLSLVGFLGYGRAWGERIMFFIFIFYMLNLVLVWAFAGSLYLVLVFLALLGFLISAPKRSFCRSCKKPVDSEKLQTEPHSEVFDVPQPIRSKEAVKEVAKVKYSPGKFVASKRGKFFHLPKSEWAKKIKKENQVWFQSKEEALKQGYEEFKERT
ncbi:hypothetical protein COY27_03310 [Candidatus Woesearchaeota archaeon CG_4_10_14_0_2_um_filter_33_13]|nr:MAG: hypothetical protein COY27_03310 [Candidatus Woesearchaeota archaeon CG_4_10_14_0_2_um_filter_33_13]